MRPVASRRCPVLCNYLFFSLASWTWLLLITFTAEIIKWWVWGSLRCDRVITRSSRIIDTVSLTYRSDTVQDPVLLSSQEIVASLTRVVQPGWSTARLTKFLGEQISLLDSFAKTKTIGMVASKLMTQKMRLLVIRLSITTGMRNW